MGAETDGQREREKEQKSSLFLSFSSFPCISHSLKHRWELSERERERGRERERDEISVALSFTVFTLYESEWKQREIDGGSEREREGGEKRK